MRCRGQVNVLLARRVPSSGRQRSRGRTAFGLRLDGSHGRGEEVSHHLAQLDLRNAHALIIEILFHLAEHVLVALLDQVRFAHGLDVVVHLRPGEAELLRRPLRQQPVAARLGAELELLVQGEFLLKGSFPLLEAGHGLISTHSARSRDVPVPRKLSEALPDGAVAINRRRLRHWSGKRCPGIWATAAGAELVVHPTLGTWPGVSIVSRPAFGYCPRLAPSARPPLFVRCSMWNRAAISKGAVVRRPFQLKQPQARGCEE